MTAATAPAEAMPQRSVLGALLRHGVSLVFPLRERLLPRLGEGLSWVPVFAGIALWGLALSAVF